MDDFFFFLSYFVMLCSVSMFCFVLWGLINSGFLGCAQDDDREELRELEKVTTNSSLVEMPVLSVVFLLLVMNIIAYYSP